MTWKVKIQDRIKLIQMSDQGPNALDFDFLNRLNREFEPDDSFDGVILTGNGRFFSAGLNIIKLAKANKKEIKNVITLLNITLRKVIIFPGPVFAVVNGFAIAGGCLLALSCDYRIGIPGNYKLGINELALGVDLPPAAIVAIRKTVPTHHRFDVSALGKFYNPEEATSVGLLNEIVNSEEAIPKALEKTKSLINSLYPFQRLKQQMMESEWGKIKNEDNFAEKFAEQWFTPETQAKLDEAVRKLKKT